MNDESIIISAILLVSSAPAISTVMGMHESIPYSIKIALSFFKLLVDIIAIIVLYHQ